LVMSVALRLFVWFLPLTALMFLIGSLMGSETPTANNN
jgi:hypothetical protein